MNANDIVYQLPDGYRWATEDEVEMWGAPGYFDRMVQVRVDPRENTATDLAIKED